jgi:transposase-like protein
MAGFLGLEELFEGRHFDPEVIVLCVRWYLRFKLSYRDLVEMMAERDLSLAHTTIMRWVHHYAPEFVSMITAIDGAFVSLSDGLPGSASRLL